MIIRIVKLTFEPTLLATFMEVFDASKDAIRAFPGCYTMQLLKDKNAENVLFTLSYWESVEALEVYRHSELFKTTWAKTKVLFKDKPEAWSTEVLDAGSLR